MDTCNFWSKMGLCKSRSVLQLARNSAHVILTISVSGSFDEEYVWAEGVPE